MGWILATLGVHLSQYLPSVSCLAIALASGAQGLVHDVVAGFCRSVAQELDFGGMVTIHGATGILQDGEGRAPNRVFPMAATASCPTTPSCRPPMLAAVTRR